MLLLKSLLLAALALNLGGCIWPLKIAEGLEAEVVDAASGNPIPLADVVYLACDFHDFSCNHATLVRTKANEQGKIAIGSTRQWGFWLPAPGGIPVPNHLVAISLQFGLPATQHMFSYNIATALIEGSQTQRGTILSARSMRSQLAKP
ncbi:hypothetical protein NITMOv2_1288 [Nitrospira moscoviensis]|uniref:Uncharacterized protein n=1 Tax=Nitrospira moscoviensis TaxID=42253 RepID=A0A0K2G9S0_NITMO|nr:hypothetical protein NITMOv2_1288 [Nitrospira moscoviensis]